MARQLLLWPVVLMLSVTAFAQLKEFKPGFNLFSKDQDIQLGKESAAQVEQQMQVINDPKLQAFIDRIGKRLASQPQAGGFPYTFKVVSDPSINAFALPGGPTFVNTGLIAAADNEDQLAAVMAHEISHVALRHGTNQATKANFIQLPAMLAGAVMGNSSLLGQLTSAGIGLGANSVLLKFSRGAESQADLNGAQLMASAGYNPIEMARFFEKLEASGGHAGPQFLSDHPNPGNRMKAIQDDRKSDQKMLEKANSQWSILNKTWLNFRKTRDRRIGLGIAGAELVLSRGSRAVEQNYMGQQVREEFEKNYAQATSESLERELAGWWDDVERNTTRWQAALNSSPENCSL